MRVPGERRPHWELPGIIRPIGFQIFLQAFQNIQSDRVDALRRNKEKSIERWFSISSSAATVRIPGDCLLPDKEDWVQCHYRIACAHSDVEEVTVRLPNL